MKTTKAYWFGRKRFGFGFGPRTWQGWVATIAYATLMVVMAQIFGDNGEHTWRTASLVGLTVGFLCLFIWKLDTSSK